MREEEKLSSRRGVSFHPKVRFQYVHNHRDLSPREKRLIWYSASSLLSIGAKNAETLALMAADKLLDEGDEYCFRGLITRKENRRLLDSVKASREVVFRIQTAQFDGGYTNDEEIAEKYAEMAYPCRTEARNRGLLDESDSPNKAMFSLVKNVQSWRPPRYFIGVAKPTAIPTGGRCDLAKRKILARVI